MSAFQGGRSRIHFRASCSVTQKTLLKAFPCQGEATCLLWSGEAKTNKEEIAFQNKGISDQNTCRCTVAHTHCPSTRQPSMQHKQGGPEHMPGLKTRQASHKSETEGAGVSTTAHRAPGWEWQDLDTQQSQRAVGTGVQLRPGYRLGRESKKTTQQPWC